MSAVASPSPGIAGRLSRALPGLGTAAGGALAWGAAMAAGAAIALLMDGWQTPHKIRIVALLFFCGGALAFPVALFLARLFSGGRRPETALAAALFFLALTTVLATAGLYGLHYRLYYAQWHSEPFTRVWFLQFAFTVAAAVYQFAVLGVRLFLPVGALALAAAVLWFVRRGR